MTRSRRKAHAGVRVLVLRRSCERLGRDARLSCFGYDRWTGDDIVQDFPELTDELNDKHVRAAIGFAAMSERCLAAPIMRRCVRRRHSRPGMTSPDLRRHSLPLSCQTAAPQNRRGFPAETPTDVQTQAAYEWMINHTGG